MQITNTHDSYTRFQRICAELYRSKREMQVKYAVKNIVKEEPICRSVERTFTSVRRDAGRGGISGDGRPPDGLSTAMFMPEAIGNAVRNGRSAWTPAEKRR